MFNNDLVKLKLAGEDEFTFIHPNDVSTIEPVDLGLPIPSSVLFTRNGCYRLEGKPMDLYRKIYPHLAKEK